MVIVFQLNLGKKRGFITRKKSPACPGLYPRGERKKERITNRTNKNSRSRNQIYSYCYASLFFSVAVPSESIVCEKQLRYSYCCASSSRNMASDWLIQEVILGDAGAFSSSYFVPYVLVQCMAIVKQTSNTRLHPQPSGAVSFRFTWNLKKERLTDDVVRKEIASLELSMKHKESRGIIESIHYGNPSKQNASESIHFSSQR
ncbi:hypothetical protein CEXT_613741 [Caerostris extrusa]|uniref:Uncharacterized protein n=1 Tax=Caerostris extrusa TaxID=172846 RepID=A0AAV4XY64_CAEEX|nr:hypothetical protein CEXT_613741 [Caerostris extrusa]